MRLDGGRAGPVIKLHYQKPPPESDLPFRFAVAAPPTRILGNVQKAYNGAGSGRVAK
jgi:hypothetical protein